MIKKYKPPFPSILLTRDGDDDGCDDDEAGNWRHYTRDWLSIILGIGWSLYRVPASLPTALSQRRLTLSRDGDDDHSDDNDGDGGDDNDGGGGGMVVVAVVMMIAILFSWNHPDHLLSTKFKTQQFQIMLLKNANVQDLRNAGILRIPNLLAVTWMFANSEEVL